jgi:putative transposase
MPRRPRYLKDNACYHITHRCHERKFLFRFAKDRQVYVDLLRETVKQFKIDVFNYVVTSNHVHLLLWVKHGKALPKAMQYLQGEFGQYFNLRKTREGAFWRDRYHSTLIQTGAHLSRCLFYIDMNMVRAGVVDHPEDWKHGGHHELSGSRQRYRILNQEQLLACLANGHDPEQFRTWYMKTLSNLIAEGCHCREPYWSEAYAVGDADWLSVVYDEIGLKRKRILQAVQSDNIVGEGSEIYYIEGR